MKETITTVLSYFLGFVFGLLILFAGYSLWKLERTWNYNTSYKSMVQQTVREMVKQEALK